MRLNSIAHVLNGVNGIVFLFMVLPVFRFFGELEANYFFYTEAVAYGALLRCLYVVVCMVNKAGTFL